MTRHRTHPIIPYCLSAASITCLSIMMFTNGLGAITGGSLNPPIVATFAEELFAMAIRLLYACISILCLRRQATSFTTSTVTLLIACVRTS